MADMLDISKDYVDPFDSDSIVAKFRDFRDRSKRKFADNYEKMRTDRDFLNGETQWTKADGRHVSDKRNRMILNVISNSVNSVVNQYSAYPTPCSSAEATPAVARKPSRTRQGSVLVSWRWARTRTACRACTPSTTLPVSCLTRTARSWTVPTWSRLH